MTAEQLEVRLISVALNLFARSQHGQCHAPPLMQIPYSVVFTKVDKKKKGCPAVEENIEAFQKVGSRHGVGVGDDSYEGGTRD